MSNILHQQRDVKDRSGIGYTHRTENRQVKSSMNQEVNPIKEWIARHRLNLRKINEPLEEVQRLLALGDK